MKIRAFRANCEAVRSSVVWLLPLLAVGWACNNKSKDDTEIELTEADRQMIRDNILTKAPAMDRVVNADFDGKLIYLGCDVDKSEVQPNEVFTLTHYWEVVTPPEPGWKLFTHLGPEWMNIDRIPMHGKYPVSEWKAGEIIRDEQRVRVPRNWAPSVIIMYVGLYRKSERMVVNSGETDGANRVVAVRLPVHRDRMQVRRPEVVLRRAWRSPILDAVLEDPAWAEATPSLALTDSEGGGASYPPSDVKMLWDDANLYLGFSAADAERSDNDALRAILSFMGSNQALDITIKRDGTVDAVIAELVGTVAGPQPTKPTVPTVTKDVQVIVKNRALIPGAAKNDGVWIAEIAIPWARLPGFSSPAGVFTQLVGNFLRIDHGTLGGKATVSSWVRIINAGEYDQTSQGVLNLGDDLGALLLTGTQIPVPAPKDLPGEKRVLALDK